MVLTMAIPVLSEDSTAHTVGLVGFAHHVSIPPQVVVTPQNKPQTTLSTDQRLSALEARVAKLEAKVK